MSQFFVKNETTGELQEVPLNLLPGLADRRTLRDQFAMAALTGYLSNNTLRITERKAGATDMQVVAYACYSMADAMLEARKQ
jgi:hypothetical protein